MHILKGGLHLNNVAIRPQNVTSVQSTHCRVNWNIHAYHAPCRLAAVK